MHNITFDLSTMHLHGSAFYQFLQLRKTFFVDELGWNIPHNDDVEMDQYDNPTAHYSLVLRGDKVVGGARVMPTMSCWGEHTYMLRDAFNGRLKDIPATAMPSEIATEDVWECTRLAISDDLTSAVDRRNCLALIVDGLVEVAAAHGAGQLLTLSTVSLVRTLRQLGYAADRIGEPYRDPGDGRKYAVLHMPAMSPRHLIAAE